MAEISIIKYNKNFKEDMINFLGLHWKSLQNQESIRELFEWKYEKNPYGKFPVNYLAADGKKIVGHVGFYLQKYKLRNHTYTFAIAADAHVHPEYRRRGIFSDIINYSTGDILKRGDIDLIIHVTYNNKSAPCVMKSGYYAIDTRKKMYLFSVLNLLKKYILSEKKLFPINTKSADLKIEITDKLRAQEISEFNGILTKDDKINNIRDTAFYKWRYSHPLEKYIIAYCKKNEDKLVGYI
ncbi:MAG: GNAT family N-acetyltransferase, partial [Actinobacteria bacterium]|nr:GNAT family N-acetyltransferase [Actinomycetota bacterium]